MHQPTMLPRRRRRHSSHDACAPAARVGVCAVVLALATQIPSCAAQQFNHLQNHLKLFQGHPAAQQQQGRNIRQPFPPQPHPQMQPPLHHPPPPPPPPQQQSQQQQQPQQQPTAPPRLPPPPRAEVLARLRETLALAAGVYRDPLKNPAMNRTVIITGTNHGYVNHLHNFKCFMDRLKLKVLVFAMDKQVHQHIGTVMDPTKTPASKAGSAFYSFFWEGSGEEVRPEATEFRSKQFNIITHRKMEGIIAVMEMQHDVIFIDMDIALLRDPLPYLLWRNVDYVHSHNRICPQFEQWDFFKSDEEGNTGFYYARSNPRTLKLWKDALALSPSHPDLDDQSVFWIHIRQVKDPQPLPLPHCGHFDNTTRTGKELVTCALDGCIFSAGGLRGVAYDWLRDNLKRKNETVVVIHANYLKGNAKKREKLKDHGYWIVKEHDGGKFVDGDCQAFKPDL